MPLSKDIAEYKASFTAKVPEDIQATMANATSELANSGIVTQAPLEGDTLADFTLSNQNSKSTSLNDLLTNGPLVITFYRGGWCPYCNLELRAYQEVFADIKAAGATLVAVTPELPDNSLSTVEKNALDFEVLSDVNSGYARSIGLVHTLAEELRPIYEGFGIHVEAHNGSGQFDLPFAATYVVGQDKKIISAFIDADYTQRQEPSEVVNVLQSQQQTA